MNQRTAKTWMAAAILLMLVSMIGASLVQTSGGQVTIKQLTVETDEGWDLDCDLYIPSSATAETPAPAIVTSHGNYNNKEMQDANFVELSRRGYVVLNVDQPNHGNSASKEGSDFTTIFSANYQGALILSRLPYVDRSRIGVTGHSAGAYSSNYAVASDNQAEERLISAVLLNCADAIYTAEDGSFSNDYYGSRDVGILSAQYDEFMHYVTGDGAVPAHFAPYFMNTANAQSFLHFGKDPAGLEVRAADTVYTETVDGEECIRAIYRPDIIHPWSHFSVKATAGVLDFFQAAFGAPNPIDSSSQIWPLKEAFNFAGLVGMVLFIVSLSVLLVHTAAFADLRAEEAVLPLPVQDARGKQWFWLSLAAGAVFSTVVYLPVITGTIEVNVLQTETFAIGCWAALCGLFTILSMAVYYRCYGKAHGFDLKARGVLLPVRKLAKTVLLAVIVCCAAYGCVFLADYFFKTDFRLWTLAFKTFGADKITLALFPYLWLYLIFYVAASVSANCFNYNTICQGKRGWGNALVVSLFVTFPALILPWMQYGYFYATDRLLFWGVNPARLQMYVLWLFPMVLILPAAVLVSRALYRVTKNPYLGGIISGIMVTMFACTNSRIFIL